MRLRVIGIVQKTSKIIKQLCCSLRILGSFVMHFAIATTIRTALVSNFRLCNPCGLCCHQKWHRQVRWCLGCDDVNARLFHLCRMLWVSHPCASMPRRTIFSCCFFCKKEARAKKQAYRQDV